MKSKIIKALASITVCIVLLTVTTQPTLIIPPDNEDTSGIISITPLNILKEYTNN